MLAMNPTLLSPRFVKMNLPDRQVNMQSGSSRRVVPTDRPKGPSLKKGVDALQGPESGDATDGIGRGPRHHVTGPAMHPVQAG